MSRSRFTWWWTKEYLGLSVIALHDIFLANPAIIKAERKINPSFKFGSMVPSLLSYA
ncbi:hypothetical protein [Mesoplasma melaleucae]|uniref:hypothetical protein n=1 Tax=Mesoplasma melaleucae TaxID=81459 RepID=UPI00146FB2CF|nr:hypothetical protein [Mesoplasma melaleucae]